MFHSQRFSDPFRRGAAKAFAVTAASGVALTLVSCVGEVPMQPAVDANDPACADVIVRLPDDLGEDLPRRATNAQATGAWGVPDAVQLRCGIEPSGPTTLECVEVNGIDWIVDDSQRPLYRFEAYGRNPGLEVIVDSEKASGTEAMTSLAQVVSLLPQERKCVGARDLFEGETTPTDDSPIVE